MHKLYLSLGSNLGNRHALIQQALQMLDERVGRITRVSKLLETEPWGFCSEHPFLNTCCLLYTELSPLKCLQETQRIEKEMGRKEKSHNGTYADRLIDIDILLYDRVCMQTPELTLPHPLMNERQFVMVPLREILLPEDTPLPTH